MIALDTTALSLLFVPGSVSYKPGSHLPIRHGRERMDALVERAARNEDRILIPTPALSELMVRIPSRIDELLKQLRSSPWFAIEGFDAAAAVEVALRTASAIEAGDKREGSEAPWAKVKFDRQIVAIALVNGASELISDDPHVLAIGSRWGLLVKSVDDLPVPEDLIPPPLLAPLEETPGEENLTTEVEALERAGLEPASGPSAPADDPAGG
ncbi:MAG: hypothetical protein KJZ79_07310 [Bryobacteraceae bacterium]|nr:hypothetical protein [Bryobacteraceae bacterium]